MKNRGMLDLETCRTLIEGFSKKGEMLQTLKLLRAMLKEDCLPEINTCITLINGFCSKQQVPSIYAC